MSVVDTERDAEIQSEKRLVDAAAAGDLETVISLITHHVSVDAEGFNKILFYASKNYVTPLQVACSNGHTECAETLIEFGADVDAKDRFDVTALHMAAEHGNYDCLKALLSASATCSPPTKFSKPGFYTAVPHLGGTTPLHLAANNNHMECVRELIQYGADYNAVDEKGRNSLCIAAEYGFNKCVLVHLKHAIGGDILSLPHKLTFDTPLHYAVSLSMSESVYALLICGSDANHLNYAGLSPLHLAVKPSRETPSVSMEILRMLILLGYNTDINQKDGNNMSPLHYVCFNELAPRGWNHEMAKLLIVYGANVNIERRKVCLLEFKLKSTVPADFEVVQYIMRSMCHVPTLSLRRDVPEPDKMDNSSSFLPLPPATAVENSQLMDKRIEWYENIASNPRTLQHYCRFAIRKSLGPRSIKYVGNLPIPNALKSYLLLERD